MTEMTFMRIFHKLIVICKCIMRAMDNKPHICIHWIPTWFPSSAFQRRYLGKGWIQINQGGDKYWTLFLIFYSHPCKSFNDRLAPLGVCLLIGNWCLYTYWLPIWLEFLVWKCRAEFVHYFNSLILYLVIC